MTEADAQLAALQELVGRLAAEDADQVLAEARAEARTRVRAALTDALTDSLREAVERRIASETSPARPPAEAPRETASPPVLEERPAEVENAAGAPAPPAVLGTYVYGVVWATDAPFTEDMSGLDDDGPVTTVVEGPLAAVISRVPLADFEE